MRWTMKETYYRKREDRRKNIYRRCYRRMKNKKQMHKKWEIKREIKILRLKKTMQRCWTNRKETDRLNYKIVKRGHRTTRIGWLIQLLKRWIKDKRTRTRRLRSMRWKEKWEIGWKMKEELKNIEMVKTRWKTFCISKWKRKNKEKT